LAHSTPVVVDERIPGFPAYEFLQPGDVILQFTDWPAVQLRVPDDFILIARRLSAGDTLRLTVRREGRPIVITMKFDYFPGEVTPTNIDAWIQDRARKAEGYWNSEFSAVDPAAAPMATQASTSVQP